MNMRSNPFPGLRPFEMEEHHLFFGREGQSDELLLKLQETRFVAVVGASGSGKSSLVRAGLLPALYSGFLEGAGSRWRMAVVRPGNAPIRNLARKLMQSAADGEGGRGTALRLADVETTLGRSSLGLVDAVRLARISAGESLLIVVDQFEELFRFKREIEGGRPDDEADAFVKLLIATTQQKELPIYVVITMRSDFLGDAAQFPELAKAINSGQYLIPGMKDEERRQAITGPVAVGGAAITPTLVNMLINDVGENPNQLPILQHALMRTWDCWAAEGNGSGPIDIPHYEKAGGMSDALSKHADEAYGELSPERQDVAETVFKSLTERGPGDREIRRPTKVGKLCAIAGASEEDVVAVVESFRSEGRSFLMPPPPEENAPGDILRGGGGGGEQGERLTADTLVDISHESLIGGWKQLKKWVEEEARSAMIYKRLAQTAELYDAGRENHLRSLALREALKWKEEEKPNEAWAGQYHPGFERALAFLEESRLSNEKEEEDRRTQLERELAQAQTLAAEQEQRAKAEEGKAAAERARTETERRRVRQQKRWIALMAALLLLMFGLTLFAFAQRKEAKAQQSVAEKQTAEAERQKGIADDKTKQVEALLVTTEQARKGAVAKQEEAEEQRRLAEEAKVSEREARTLAEQQRTSAELAKADAVRQKDRAEGALRDAKIAEGKAVDARTEADKQRGIAERNATDAKTAAAAERTATKEANTQREKADAAATTAAEKEQEAKNQQAKAERALSTLRNVDRNTPDFVGIVRHDKPVISASFVNPASGDVGPADAGPLVLTVSRDDGIKLSRLKGDNATESFKWKTKGADGKDVETDAFIKDDGCGVNSAVASPDGKLIVAACRNGKARVWSASDGKELSPLAGHKGPITSVAFSGDGKYLVTGDEEAARVWETSKLPSPTDREDSATTAKTISPVRVLPGGGPVTVAVFSDDAKWLATTVKDGSKVFVWNIEKPNEPGLDKELEGLNGPVKSIAFSPSDKKDKKGRPLSLKIAATAVGDKVVEVWEQGGGTWGHARTLAGHRCQVNSVEFSHDGTLMVTASDDGSAFVWDARSGDLKHELRGYRGILLSRTHRDTRVMILGAISGGKLGPFPFSIDLQAKEGEFVPVSSARFSADDKRVVTASDDGKLRVWGSKKGIRYYSTSDKPLVLQGHSKKVLSVSFSPDSCGEYVLAASEDGSARVWVVKPYSAEPLKQCGGKRPQSAGEEDASPCHPLP